MAFCIYNVVGFATANFLYGLIFMWVLIGSRSRSFKDDNMDLNANV